jgi:hypothetical protein
MAMCSLLSRLYLGYRRIGQPGHQRVRGLRAEQSRDLAGLGPNVLPDQILF